MSGLDADMNMSVMMIAIYDGDMNADVTILNPWLHRIFMYASITNAIHMGLFMFISFFFV